MRVLVTGATGFIGRHLLPLLVAQGHAVHALRHTQAPWPLPGVTWLHGSLDVLDASALDGVDVLMHLASAGVPPREASWSDMLEQNALAPLRLLQRAHAAGVRRCVWAGSFAEYGRSADGLDFIPADTPLLPTYGYAASKAAGFMAAHGFAVEAGMELAYLRIFSAYGEGQFAQNFWPALRAAALAGEDFAMTPGAQVRDYVPVESVALVFAHAASRGDLRPGRPWVRNVGSGQPVSMLQFAQHWWQRWNASGRLLAGALPYRPNEIMRFVPVVEQDIWPTAG